MWMQSKPSVSCKMSCDHKRGRWAPGGTDDWTGEDLPDVWIEEYTSVDIDVGRFKCTQCGEIGYYTGLWKRYFEEGVPCSGSDGVPR